MASVPASSLREARARETPFDELQHLQTQLQKNASVDGLVGTSAPIQLVRLLISRAMQFNFPVVILGESGTGKELVARSIHFSGLRKTSRFLRFIVLRSQPHFLNLNCSAMYAEPLLEPWQIERGYLRQPTQ